jgi:hypothetical protein
METRNLEEHWRIKDEEAKMTEKIEKERREEKITGKSRLQSIALLMNGTPL